MDLFGSILDFSTSNAILSKMKILAPAYVLNNSSCILASILEDEAKKKKIWISLTKEELINILSERKEKVCEQTNS